MTLIFEVILAAALIVLVVFVLVSDENGVFFRLYRFVGDLNSERKAQKIARQARQELAARRGQQGDQG